MTAVVISLAGLDGRKECIRWEEGLYFKVVNWSELLRVVGDVQGGMDSVGAKDWLDPSITQVVLPLSPSLHDP